MPLNSDVRKEKMKHISEEAYKKDFEINANDRQDSENNENQTALKYAIETRQFEISLYWERAKYFWTFIAAAFAAFGVIQRVTNEQDKIFLSILVSCLGLLFSFAWYCVNRGSKQWQENWENHVALLEDNTIGPLFKTILTRDKSQKKLIRDLFIGPGAFSVSKINQLVSVYITFFWLFLLMYSTLIKWETSICWPYFIPIILTMITCAVMFFWGRSDFNKKDQEFDYIHTAKRFSMKIEPQNESNGNDIGEPSA